MLKKYNKIWNKASSSIKKGFDSESVHNEEYLKTKINSYDSKINRNFHDNGKHKEDYQFISLTDSVFNMGKIYYEQVFLEECKYIVKE